MINITEEERSYLIEIAQNKIMRSAIQKFAQMHLQRFETRLLNINSEEGVDKLIQLKSEYDGAKKLYNDIIRIREFVSK